MIPNDRKRMAKVDFRIAAVSRHATRKKRIEHGDSGTVHILRTDPQPKNNRRKE